MADDTALADYVKSVVHEEAKPLLEPLVERVSREYLFIDRKTAYKLLCMSQTFFYQHVQNKPQVKLIERHIDGSDRVFYDPNELKAAVLSISQTI